MPPSKAAAKSDSSPPTERLYGGLTSVARKEQRRSRLIGAAFQLFGTEGFADVTIEALCAEAGVGIRAFYDEFGTRDALFTAVFFEVTDAAFADLQLELEASAGQPLGERLERALAVYLHFVLDDPRRARITAVETPRGDMGLVAQRRQNSQRLVSLTESAIAGHDEQTESDLGLWAVFMVGGVRELIIHWMNSDPRPDIDDLATKTAQILLRSLGA